MSNINLLSRRVEKIIPDKSDLDKLLKKKKVRLYQGFDPTGGRLHLGHSVGLRKLMEFANAGHEVIFLFGTGTVLVGDPSEREKGRETITEKAIDENIKYWKKQAKSIVDFSQVKIMKNGEWLTKLKLKDIIKIASNISAVQLFKRDMFQKRLDKGDTVWYHETMYPLLQGYDSVVMDVDLEIGGTDQEFNMLIGRELMKKMKNKEKYILTTPMILGTDGKQMSKTSGNCVWLDDKPNDMFGKLMSIPDKQIIPYMKSVTDIDMEEIGETEKNLNEDLINPIDAKKRLAHWIVSDIYSKKLANSSRDYFENTFQEGTMPSKAAILKIDAGKTINITDAIATKLGSKSKAKRLISQGAVDVNGDTINNFDEKVEVGDNIKVGKKIFFKVIQK
jgi:tyrosyl-tRNA synthetase